MKRYLALALLSFGAYSLVPPLLKVAMRTIPSTPAVVLSNAVMLVLLGVLIAVRGESPLAHLRGPYGWHVVLWGVTLAVGLLTYYRAIALGPVSVVVPIYGLFIPLSSLVGIVAFDETLTARKAAGIALAVLAIVLMSV